jgi:hypothetical protein
MARGWGRAMAVVLSTRLPERQPHLRASRPSAIDATTPTCVAAVRPNFPRHSRNALGLTALLLNSTYTHISYIKATSESWVRLRRIARGWTRIVPTSSRRHADSRQHSIAVLVQTRELTRGHTECTLTASALFSEALDGKAIVGSVRVCLLVKNDVLQWRD